MGRIFVVGTADTKGEELAYLRAAVAEAGRAPIVVDVGIGPPRCDVDIARSEVAAHHPAGAHFLGSTDRGEAVAAMGGRSPVCVDPRRHRCHARNRRQRRQNLHRHQGHAIASDRRAKS
jgi:uncharacterized protein (UPF0261 family)